MCSGPEQSNPNSSTTQGAAGNKLSNMNDSNKMSMEMEDTVSNLLEYAANNDAVALRRSIQLDSSAVDRAGLWYVRKKGSKHITREEITPLMIGATYGSIDVLELLVAVTEVDLNKSCGQDKWTALHCAAFGGSVNSFDAIKLLLSAGADPNIEDVSGQRPIDVLVVPPMLPGAKTAILGLLMGNSSDGAVGDCNLKVSICSSDVYSPVLSSSPESGSPCSPAVNSSVSERKQYPMDPSLPDIRNSVYSTDEFRMFSFKIKPCSRAYSHDWTECPFAHPGENARRRDPRKYHYSCVPCPDFRKGDCKRGDMCEYAHGVFECWLHPGQYRTRMCKDGTSCARQVCFFAHTHEELRPLYPSTGSGVPSPRSASFMDMAAALNHLPSSPSSQSIMSPAFNQAMSPTGNGMSHLTAAWPQPSVPTLHLPSSNLKSSRLRSSLSARDIPPEDLHVLQDFDTNLAHVLQPRSGQPKTTLTPSNLEELFCAEISSSPRFSDQAGTGLGPFSASRKSAAINQFQQRASSVLSPNSTDVFSPRNVGHPLFPLALDASSPRMSPRSFDAAFAQREKRQQHQQIRSLSSQDLGSSPSPIVGSPTAAAAWSNWGCPNRKASWAITGDDQACLKRSGSLDLRLGAQERPDLSWVKPLVKESSPELIDRHAAAPVISGEYLKPDSQIDSIDHSVLGAWLEQIGLDQLVV